MNYKKNTALSLSAAEKEEIMEEASPLLYNYADPLYQVVFRFGITVFLLI